ncbi:MAG: hypothetical protein ABF868_07670 [Sporolactobacillus sp.]
MRRLCQSGFLIVAVLAVALSGCSLLEQPSALIQQPNLPQDKRLLLRDISALIPPGAHLLSPAACNVKGRIVRLSLQRGSAGQATYFYEQADGSIFFGVANFSGGHWKKLYDHRISSEKVVKVAYVNSGPDFQTQIIMTTEKFPQNHLFIYSMVSGKVDRILSVSFNGWIRGYIDGNGHSHLAFVENATKTGEAVFFDYILDRQSHPLLVARLRLNAPTHQMRIIRRYLHAQRPILTNPDIAQINELTDVSDMGTRQLRGAAILSNPFTPGAGNYLNLQRQSFRSPFSGSPLVLTKESRTAERYYNVAHHFFLDFPERLADNLVLTKETGSHVTFSRKDNEQPYVSVYWMTRSDWRHANHEDWHAIGMSDYYVYAVPGKEKAAAESLVFGVYENTSSAD